MRIKCLIVDDEPLARDLIRNYIGKLGNIEIVGECRDAIGALQLIRKFDVDLLFMDVQMPHISGIDFLKTLKNPPKVIITTAHAEYAINGFELDVMDYLLKPVKFERFLKAVNKYFRLLEKEKVALGNESRLPAETSNEFIYVKENKKAVKLYLDDIQYIEGLSEYVSIYTQNKKLVVKSGITKLEKKLPAGRFMRIHKSYIVALDKIKAYTATSVEVPERALPVSRTYKNAVFEILNASAVESYLS